MTVYNAMPYLPLAIDSILNQTYAAFEFLIVNDCSTDSSREVILRYRDPRIRLLDNTENIGQTRSLNRGLEHLHSELVARIDADDISHPQRLERQIAYLRTHQDVAAVGTGRREVDDIGTVIRQHLLPERDLPLRFRQFFACPLSGGAAVFRTGVVWTELGGFDPSFKIVQDWELWSRVLPKYKLANVPEALLDVRVHPRSVSATATAAAREERRRVVRLNLRRILNTADGAQDRWSGVNVDMFVTEHLEALEERLSAIGTLFEGFCALYPEARDDPEVLRELSIQYLRTLSLHPRGLPVFLRALRLARAASPGSWRGDFCRLFAQPRLHALIAAPFNWLHFHPFRIARQVLAPMGRPR